MDTLTPRRTASRWVGGHRHLSLLAAVSLLAFVAATDTDLQFREWNDLHDRRFEAKLIAVSEGSVRLANREGKEIDFPMEDLSSVDKAYAHLWTRAGGDPKGIIRPSEFRNWKDLSGRVFEARLIHIGARMVKLENRTGRQTTFPIAELSPGDKDHIHDWDIYGKLQRGRRPIPSRRWTDNQDRYFEAQLVDAASETVRFQNREGKRIVYLIADLSRADRFFLERLSRDDVPADPGSSVAGGTPALDGVEMIGSKLAALRAGKPNFIAVLINGDSSTLHKTNLLTAFESMRKMGHADESIVVLSSNFAPSSRFGRGARSVTAAATLRNVRAVFGGLNKLCTPDDTVFVYTTGHGVSHPKGGAYLVLENKGGYPAREFGDFVGGLKGKFIAVMDQCFSGGLVEAIPASRPNTIAISAAPPDKKTFCKYFAESFWKSIQNPQCDGDGDGVISISEAFDIAIKEHRRRVTWASTDGMRHVQPRDVVLMPKLIRPIP